MDAAPTPADVGAAEIELERSLLARGSAAADIDATIPVIDMSQPDEAVAAEMWEAASSVGFFTVVGHGIPQEVIERSFGVAQDFFSLSQEEKESASPFAQQLNSGYEYMKQVRPSTGTADQKESLQVTARRGCMEGRWPASPVEFEEASRTMAEGCNALVGRILSLLEPKACPDLAPGTLAGAHTLWGDDGQCTLRYLHYPPMDVAALDQLTGGGEGGAVHWRAGPHTDWDCITLLFQRVGQAGLECSANPRDMTKAQGWAAVPPTEGGIAINIGDMLSRWSDGRLHSNLHRVRMPTKEECTPPSSRYSIAFFAQADKATVISSRESEPITAGDYILSRIRANFAKG